MFRFLLFACLLTCSLGAETIEKRPRLGGKILGARPVNIEDFPYQVSIVSGNTHRCSGAIISHDWAVTAGQCFDGLTPANVRFVSGSSYKGGTGNIHNVTQLILHPDYNYYTLDNDIGLAEVSVPFIYGPSVQPAKLKSVSTTYGAPAVVTGWGTRSLEYLSDDSLLQAFTVDIIDEYECYDNYGVNGGMSFSMFCAVGDGGGKDACLGDVGGPLVAANILVGLWSWGIGCGDTSYPAMYTNVAYHSSYVTYITGVE